MAAIDIFPLAFDSFRAPLNLIDNALTQVTPKHLLYPIDLASNPNYCHAVQFTIFDFETDGMGKIFQQIGQQGVNALGVSTKKSSPRAYINLYMPDTAAVDYNSMYDEVSLTDTFGPIGYLANAAADTNKTSINQNSKNLLSAGIAKGLGLGLGKIPGVNGDNVTGLLRQKLGVIPNPQMQLIYRGIKLRNFQLEFIFTPVSRKEADNVDQIIKAFEYYSLPLIKRANMGQFLEPPQVFSIDFKFMGSSNILSGITNVFDSTMRNIFDSSIVDLLTGTTPESKTNDIKSAKQAKIFSVGNCVLESLQVDHAPNGWATYNDGIPVQTRLTLNFKEMDIRTKADIYKEGKKPTDVDEDEDLDDIKASIDGGVDIYAPPGSIGSLF